MDDTGKDVLFGKRMFGGFSRRDVMRYIDTLQKQNLSTVQGGEDALRRARAQVQTLTTQLEQATARIESLETQLGALQAQYAETACTEQPQPAQAPSTRPEPPVRQADSAPEAHPAAREAQSAPSPHFAQTPSYRAKKSGIFKKIR